MAENFLALLTLLFVALKLTGHITWSWAWVLSPVWIPILLVIMFFVLGVGVHFLVAKWG